MSLLPVIGPLEAFIGPLTSKSCHAVARNTLTKRRAICRRNGVYDDAHNSINFNDQLSVLSSFLIPEEVELKMRAGVYL